MRRYHSFVLRCWEHGDQPAGRVEIEHIQSRDRALVESLAEAIEWISAQYRGPDGGPSHDHSSGRTPR